MNGDIKRKKKRK